MKKKITALLVGIFTLVINTYAQTPQVTFTATPSVICPGDTVRFTNTATFYPTSWTWYMPGSTLSQPFTNPLAPGNPPPVVYNYPGTYYVTCVVVNPDGRDSATVPACVIVRPAPTAIIMPPSGGICDTAKGKGLDTVFFSLKDTTKYSQYLWTPPTNITCATCKTPGVYPGKTTVYTLTIQGIDGCKATAYDTVFAGKIVAKITGHDSICAGASDTLIGSGGSEGGTPKSNSKNPGTTYIWSNGKTTSSIVVNPLVTTTYNLHIASGNGPCISDTNFTVNVFALPHYSFTASPADSVCYPGTVTFSLTPGNNGPYQYYWYGPPYGVYDTAILTILPQASTTYTLVVRNLGCYTDSLIKVKVNKIVRPSFTGPANLCQGSQATITLEGLPKGTQYIWTNDNNKTTSSINIQPVITTTYRVFITEGGCHLDTDFTVNVDTMPNFAFKGDTSICVNTSTTIYAYSKSTYGYQYLWNDGTTVDSVVTPILTGAQTYYLTISKGACSKDSSQIIVKVYPRPDSILFPVDTLVCEYDSVPLTAAGGNYYIWSETPTTPNSLNHIRSPYYTLPNDTDINKAAPSVTTRYTVKICTWGCCTGDKGVVPTLPGSPTALISIIPGVQGYSVCCNETVAGGTPVQLSATYNPGPYYIEGWTPSTGLSCTTCPNPTSTVYNTTKYIVTFADLYTGCLVNDSVTIDIFNCNVFVPNVFSPNGDGVNDLLYVRSICLKSMDFAIFDRWGNKLFETSNQDTPWNGTYKGKDMEMGTYVWFLTGLEEDGTHISQSGNVSLIR